jgi:hypothetical protein
MMRRRICDEVVKIAAAALAVREMAMDWWSVKVEARSDAEGAIDQAAIDKFLDLTRPYQGSVGAGSDPPRWGATVSIEAAGVAEAVDEAVRLLTNLAVDAGLPIWPTVRAEASREDVLTWAAGPPTT